MGRRVPYFFVDIKQSHQLGQQLTGGDVKRTNLTSIS